MTLLERRLRSEWELLLDLTEKNPGRLAHAKADDTTFHVTLLQTPALSLPLSPSSSAPAIFTKHELRIDFPVHYPAVPMMLHLNQPAAHPNIHPENGFVCLWSQHRVSNTVEHALHKTVAILGWKLFNDSEIHVMQPEALKHLRERRNEIAAELICKPLQGLTYIADSPAPDAVRRRRLS